MSDNNTAKTKICVSCGSKYENNYCSNCGQKEMHHNRFSVLHLFEEVFELFTHIDNKIFHSLWYVISKPGFLTKEYLEGKTVKYMKPLQLFLVINVLFFLFLHTGSSNPLSLSLDGYYKYDPYVSLGSQNIVDKQLAVKNISYEEYKKLFDIKIEQQSKLFTITLIPLFGTIFWLMFFRKRKYWAEHIITATHFICFVMIFWIFQYYGVILPLYYLFKGSINFELILSLNSGLIIGVYSGLMFRRVYEISKRTAILTGVLNGTLIFFGVAMLYRMLLFYKLTYFG